LVSDVDRAGLARVLDGNAVGVHGDDVGGIWLSLNGRGRLGRATFGFFDLFDDGIDAGIGLDGLLAREGGFNFVSKGEPIAMRTGIEGAKGADDLMAIGSP
jgi:hypothetical protein